MSGPDTKLAITRKNRKRRLWPLAFSICSFFLFVATSYAAYLVTRSLNIPQSQVYVFETGASASDLANMLHDSGYLQYPELLVWVAKTGQFEHSLKAGEYQFQPDFNILQVLTKIVEGKSIDYQIQFIEGWTFSDYLNELKNRPNLEQTLSDIDIDTVSEQVGISTLNPEGWFFPDTYNYNSGQSDLSILQRSNAAMIEILEREWANRLPDLPYQSAYECLIAASIIQKESNLPEEYPIIAGVIVNRLNRGMRLQMDPTVIYGLGGIDGPLKRSQLDQDTPYNTYTRSGLPPTPIAMPGLAAIQAAAQPAQTDYLYFVAQGDGSHKFSETIDEHLEAVRDYRNFQKKQS